MVPVRVLLGVVGNVEVEGFSLAAHYDDLAYLGVDHLSPAPLAGERHCQPSIPVDARDVEGCADSVGPVAVDYSGQKKFLVDASVFPGSSGSPVFLFNPGYYYEKPNVLHVGTRIMFLGILTEVFFREEQNRIISKAIPTSSIPVALSREMIDLGVVYKSSAILETIEHFMKEKGVKS